MREGKHQIEDTKDQKKPRKLKTIFTCIFLIGVIVAGGFYLKDILPEILNNIKIESEANTENNNSEDEKRKEKQEKIINSIAPIIYYYNRDNEKEIIKDGTLFQSYTKIEISRGDITVFTKDGKDFKKEYLQDEELADGEYFIKVEAEDGMTCEKSFIIDTIPPRVTGIRNKKTYREAPIIKLEELDEIEEATLTIEKNVINLKKESIKQDDGTFSYTVEKNGEYALYAKDIHGIEIKRTFKVEIE